MEFRNVTCYGTGVIGSAWGVNFLMKGMRVSMYDLDEEKLADARAKVVGTLDFFRSRNVIDDKGYSDCLERVRYTCSAEEAVRDAQFIQESGPENVVVKRSIVRAIERYCSPDAIISSSTSGIIVSEIAAEAGRPERIVGAHPYNPVYLMPLVELAGGEKTSKQTLERAKAFYREVGKEPVVLNRECPGFIANRIQMSVIRESYDLVDRGICSVEDVDKAVVFGLGLRWAFLGPHLLGELGGGKGGLLGASVHMVATTKTWFEDMAKWTEVPAGYIENKAVPGLAEEMANRKPGTGQTRDELARYRDDCLVEVLKLHGKL